MNITMRFLRNDFVFEVTYDMFKINIQFLSQMYKIPFHELPGALLGGRIFLGGLSKCCCDMIGCKIHPIAEHHSERPHSILLMFKHFDYITFIGESGAFITPNNLCRWSSKLCCWRFSFYKCHDNVCDTGKTVGYYQPGFQIKILIG